MVGLIYGRLFRLYPAQLLVWFILQGRLNTKERLFRFGLPGIEDNLCVFCKEPKIVDHVIFGCRCSSRLWYFCCCCWNLSLCFPKDPVPCFLSWMDAPFTKFDMWQLSPFDGLGTKLFSRRLSLVGKLRRDCYCGG